MTVLELLCSPFRIVKTIIRNHLPDSIPESTVAELDQLYVISEKAFVTTITTETDSGTSAVDCIMILPALHTQLSHEFLYSKIVGLLPADVITKLQGELPEFPPQASAINWSKLIRIFLEIHQYVTEKTQVAGQEIGPVDLLVSFAYTRTLLHLSRENLDYDEDKVAHELGWILEQIRIDKHKWLHQFYTVLEEETDLPTIVEIKHNAQKLARGVSDYPYSSGLPDWIRNPDYPTAKTVEVLGKFTGRLAEIQTMTEERKTYNLNAQPPSESKEDKKSGNTPSDDKPTITILGPMQTRLFKTLSYYTDISQHSDLEKLLEYGFIEDRVYIKISPGSFSYVFKQAMEKTTAHCINTTFKEVAHWLAAYFDCGKNNPKPVSEVYVQKVLRGNAEVNKTNQIRLKS